MHGGPYKLVIGPWTTASSSTVGERSQRRSMTHVLSLTPFRRILKDYFMVCDSYYQADPHRARRPRSRPSTWAAAACTMKAPACCRSA